MRNSFLLVLCLAAACGDSAIVTPDANRTDAPPSGPACNDGIDNDGDGKTDYPNDPGCSAPNQEDESDDCPTGPNCPQCADGVDNDNNGVSDFPNDPGCESASDPTEFVENPVACGATLIIANLPVSGVVTGNLDGMSTSQITSTCGGGAGSSALAYRFTLTQATVVTATTDSTFDAVLDLRSAGCAADTDEILCNDDISTTNDDSTLTKSLPAGTYFLIVSGHDSSEMGQFTLTVLRQLGEGTACTPSTMCGPGLVCRTPLGGAGDVCTQPQCGDTLDDDGDGKNGFPADPGCSSAEDNDETDDCPSGPNCPACSNGVDDDGDTLIDYPLDTSCTSAGGQSEACNGEQDPIASITMGTTTGNAAGAHNDHDPSCISATPDGVDVLYTLRLPMMRSVTIDTIGSSFDTVLSLLNGTCSEPSLACNDQGASSVSLNAAKIDYANLAAGTYIVAVDEYISSSAGAPGPFNVHVTGVIAPGGSCAAADTLGGALACPASNPCANVGGAMKCMPSACGDGMDNDGDGLADFPLDPGCTSLDDTTEGDMCPGVGPGCPQCADGVDNDGDGLIDSADPSCTTPSNASEGCASTDGVEEITTPSVTGTTAGASNDYAPTCGASTNTAPDKTYSLTLPALRSLNIANTNSFDSVTTLFGATCGGTPLACRDPNTMSLTNLAAGTYYYTIDGYSSGSGAFTLAVSGVIANNGSCEGPLAQSGALVCNTGFACKGAVGARTCARAACNDGLDNDADGIADYPNDPGCASVNDDDESDTCPGGADCPVCSDGIDNDGDGMIDYPDDQACSAASGTSEACQSTEPITPLVAPITTDTTVGSTNDLVLACGSSTNTAGDKLYSLTIPKLATLSIVNVNSFDAVVALLDSTCSGTALQCMDTPEDITLSNVPAGTYYYAVDGYSTATGSYMINLSGTIATGDSCESPLVTAGALTCATGGVCGGTAGSRTCLPAACSDGIDNDSDGAIDYPFDPGCASPSDNDEANPATASVCSNGMDDDGDAATDFPADYGCSSAAGTSEVFCAAEVDPVALITANPTTGTTTGAANNFATSTCISTSGEDVGLALSLPVPVTSLTLDLSGTTFDTVMTLRDTTCGTQLACDDQGGTGDSSKITVSNLAAGNYAVIVDGWGGADGAFTLATTGIVAAGTSCTSPLFTSGVLACPTGTTCTGTPLKCQ